MGEQALGSVVVVGRGNWGNSLAATLRARGLLAAWLHGSPSCPAWRAADLRTLSAPVLWLAVPDRAIEGTAARLVQVRPNLTGQIVVHSSGALDRSVLSAIADAGAQTGSVHPMMSFPTRRVVPLDGVRFAIEAETPVMAGRMARLVRSLGGIPTPIESASKGIYHAGAMFGSPLLVATIAAGVRALCAAGRSEREALELLLPMATATIENVRRRGLEASFSGPIARGDVATLKVHRRALLDHPLLAHAYDALASLAAEPSSCGELPCADRRVMSRALSEPVQAKERTASVGTRRKQADRRG